MPTLIALAEGMDAAPARSDDAIQVFSISGRSRRSAVVITTYSLTHLVRMLKSKNDDRRGSGDGPGASAARRPGRGPCVVDATNDPHPVVRRYAAEALERYDGLEGETAPQALLATMRDPDFWVRINAG